jgi:beta-galactosidase
MKIIMHRIPFRLIIMPVMILSATLFLTGCGSDAGYDSRHASRSLLRERISINDNWRFFKYDSQPDGLVYDVRPGFDGYTDDRPADTRPAEGLKTASSIPVLKDWILPTGNDFIKDPDRRYSRPVENPGDLFPFVRSDFNDGSWSIVNLPHDWAIGGPFLKGQDSDVGGGMGRLPSPGVAWYRKKLEIPASDAGRLVFLDIDGAMSYAMVWLNGKLVGGWPYGYASWRLDLTPYIIPGCENQLAIRLDNPPASSRWYPGGGIYRNVWLTKTGQVHVGQWGTFITANDISEASATINVAVNIDNDSDTDALIKAVTRIFLLDSSGHKKGRAVATIKPSSVMVTAGEKAESAGAAVIRKPKLWGPPPEQSPYRYVAVTTLSLNSKPVDRYETRFGIRALRFDADSGLFINGEHIKIRGVNLHHDLGALGAAFNVRAAERQLEILREMGCNAIRTSHNPPAPEFLELTDRMGFLVMDEAFDVWELEKTPLDFHLIFPEWHEQDLRAFVRRDRNCPSVIIWSFGNEVGEQYTGEDGAAMAVRLHDIIREEDNTRPATSAMNWARPGMPFAATTDIISLNYQGEGIRDTPEFEGTDRIRTPPMYPAFQDAFPGKMILSSETSSALSSRGIYLFPVTGEISSPVRDGRGGDSGIRQVSSYELYAVDFGSSPDKVFGSLGRNPFVAGEFVWTGWDYLGEPTPYYDARSSYSGIVDLAGFKKDRFYIYQAQWRPDLPVVHILPHWNWPGRTGEITPVHVFTSGDEAELFLNGRSMGRKKKDQHEYRLKWDDVIYEPGELKVTAYRNGLKWAEEVKVTAGRPEYLDLTADRKKIKSDGKDLSFITVRVTDREGRIVPDAGNMIRFSIEGPGEIVATDNGDPSCLTSFLSKERRAFGGLALVIVRTKKGIPGVVTIRALSDGLREAHITIECE